MMNIENLKDNLFLRSFALFKIPLIFFCSPKVVELNSRCSMIDIPLNYRTKNHLGSMYFGVLSTGADCAAGLLPMKIIRDSGEKVSLSFKTFKANFVKRAYYKVRFVCEEGDAIKTMMEEVLSSGERVNQVVKVKAYSSSKGEYTEEDLVADFELELSLKKQS